MKKLKLLLLILTISVLALVVVFQILNNYSSHHRVKVYLLSKFEQPIVGIEKIDDKIVLESMKPIVERENLFHYKVYFGNGTLIFAKLDLDRKRMEEVWRYSLKGYRIFSYPCVDKNGILIAVVDGKSFNKSEIVRIRGHKIEKVATLNMSVLRIIPFDNDTYILTGYTGFSPSEGVLSVVKGRSEIFNLSLGNKTLDAFVLDRRHDFIVSWVDWSTGHCEGYVSLFKFNKEVERVEIPYHDVVWDIKSFDKDKVILIGAEGVYLLDLSSMNIKTLFKSEDHYFLSPMGIVDIDNDGLYELFGIYHNETSDYFIELKYMRGKLQPVLKYPVSIRGSFAVKHLEGGYFISSSPDCSLYLIQII